jgi:dTMP kinase
VKKFNNFITFEGPEGSGKSTIAKMIKEYLETNGKEVVLTREPGGTGIQFAETIREVIMKHGEINPMTELLLFESARKEHLESLIKPSVNDKKIVICDRFADSSTVYQGMVKGLGKERVQKLNDLVIGDD